MRTDVYNQLVHIEGPSSSQQLERIEQIMKRVALSDTKTCSFALQ